MQIDITKNYYIKKQRNGDWSIHDNDTIKMSTARTREEAEQRAHRYEAKHEERLTKLAEKKAQRQAEKKAEAERIANLPADPATPRQIAYIRSLIASGTGEGFMAAPKDLTTLSKADASMLITSLKGEY